VQRPPRGGPRIASAHENIAWAVLGLWKRDLARAKEESQTALALNPNFADAYGILVLVEIYSGNPLAAIPLVERAMRLDPAFAQQSMHFLGTAYLVADKFETAAATFRERIRRAPDTDLSRAFLASALGQLGEVEEARRVWAELKKINPKYSFDVHLARLPFRNKADADRIAEGLTKAGLPD
jgi:adenylate cyclase